MTLVRKIALVSILVVVLSTSAAARTKGACDAPHAKTTIATAHARLFRVPGGRSFACLYRVGRKVSLGLSITGDGPSFTVLRQPHLAGVYVAYVRFNYDYGLSDSRVVVRDLRTGHIVHRADAVHGTVPVDASVPDLVLSPAGAAAWITRDESTNPSEHFEVWKAESHGSQPVQLDSGPGITPGSLALSQSTVYWTSGGQPRAAPLR